MLTHTLERNPNPVVDGWSRGPDGSIEMETLEAFRVFGALQYGQAPAYAVNLVYERGMSFEAFLDKNGIALPAPVIGAGALVV